MKNTRQFTFIETYPKCPEIIIVVRRFSKRLYKDYNITNCSVLLLLCSTKTCFPLMIFFRCRFCSDGW